MTCGARSSGAVAGALVLVAPGDALLNGFGEGLAVLVAGATGAGKGSVLFHQAASDEADGIGTQYVREAAAWFESMWTSIAKDSAA